MPALAGLLEGNRDVTWERIAERKIREAMSEGKFDNLPRRDAIELDEYFKLPAELRMAYSVLKSAGCVPEEVELLKEVHRIQTELDGSTDPVARQKLERALADAKLSVSLALERQRRSEKSG